MEEGREHAWSHFGCSLWLSSIVARCVTFMTLSRPTPVNSQESHNQKQSVIAFGLYAILLLYKGFRICSF